MLTSGKEGGAVRVESNRFISITVQNSNFDSNQANEVLQGGAFYSKKLNKVTIKNTNFNSNVTTK